jgi:PPM family protein phosphatase
MASHGDIVVHVYGRTDVGRTREHNEDAFVVADLTADNTTLQPQVRTHVLGPKGTLFMVADGMGGAAAGEIASAMAIEVVLEELRKHWISQADDSAENFARALKSATRAANQAINAFAASHPEFRGMGTTATIAGLVRDTLYVGQVGDSRAYLVREDEAIQITKDQSLMQKLIDAGELTEEEAAMSERRNIILQALGPEATIKVDLTHQRVRRGDTLVLCSDGLSGQVTRQEIAEIVAGTDDLTVACKQLIDRANQAGGPDNITVIVARFDGDGLDEAEDSDQVGHQEFYMPDAGGTPAMPFDRVPARGARAQTDESARPTRPVADDAMFERSELESTDASDDDDAAEQDDEEDEDEDDGRRRTGTLIAVALLVLLILAGGYWVYTTVLARS